MAQHWVRRQRKMAAVVRMHNDQRVINKRVRAVARMTFSATMHPYVTHSDRNHPMYRHFMELADALPDGAISPELSYVMTRPEGRTGIGPNRFSKKISEDAPTRSYMLAERLRKRAKTHQMRMAAYHDIAERVDEYHQDLADAHAERQQELADEIEQYIKDMRYEYERVADYDDDFLYSAYPYEPADDTDDDERVYGHDWWTYEPLPHAPGQNILGCGCRECIPMMSALPLWVETLAPDLLYPTLMTDETVPEHPRDGFHMDGARCFDTTKSRFQRRCDQLHDREVDRLLAN